MHQQVTETTGDRDGGMNKCEGISYERATPQIRQSSPSCSRVQEAHFHIFDGFLDFFLLLLGAGRSSSLSLAMISGEPRRRPPDLRESGRLGACGRTS